MSFDTARPKSAPGPPATTPTADKIPEQPPSLSPDTNANEGPVSGQVSRVPSSPLARMPTILALAQGEPPEGNRKLMPDCPNYLCGHRHASDGARPMPRSELTQQVRCDTAAFKTLEVYSNPLMTAKHQRPISQPHTSTFERNALGPIIQKTKSTIRASPSLS